MAIITRTIEPVVRSLAQQYPVLTITGPRQSGKTTLARIVFADKPYTNLESPDIRQFATEDPRGFLYQFPDGAVIDEIQRVPELTSYIQPMVDDDPRPGRFILTGSQQFEMTASVTQSLAGRTALVKLLPLSMDEIESGYSFPDMDSLLHRGFYPRIWDQNLEPTQALGDYYETYVERDLRQLVAIKDLSHFQRFVRLCAGRAGQLINASSLANDAGVSHTTAANWLSVLSASYIIFMLQPFHANISKRLVKSPKLYFYDVGLAVFLLGIENKAQLSRDPLKGNLFENMIIAEALKFRFNRGKKSNIHFYRDSRGNEVDLVFTNGPDLFPVEIKAGMTITRNYFNGLKHFKAEFANRMPNGSGLIYSGEEGQSREGVTIIPARSVNRLFEIAEC